MAVRKAHAQSLTFCASPLGTRHTGRNSCFVDKDQTLRSHIELVSKPSTPPGQNIESILFYRVASLSLRKKSRRANNRSRLNFVVKMPRSTKVAHLSAEVAPDNGLRPCGQQSRHQRPSMPNKTETRGQLNLSRAP
jgi:hypothetical protein